MKSQTVPLYCPSYFLFGIWTYIFLRWNSKQEALNIRVFHVHAKIMLPISRRLIFPEIKIWRYQYFLRTSFWGFCSFRKSARIYLCKISIFLLSAKIKPQKILQVLKIAGRYVPYTRPVWNFVKAVFKVYHVFICIAVGFLHQMSIEVLLTAWESSKQRSAVPHTSVNNKQYEKAKMTEVYFKTFYESFSFVLNFFNKDRCLFWI